MDRNEYLEKNRESWNKRTAVHLESDFYNNEDFIKGNSSLNSIELDLLGDVSGKKILHLQCHFGQDSISLSRMGAEVTGMDLSDEAINAAIELAKKTNQSTKFICCDVYDLPSHLNEKFDIVFTSYGTIGWLPDMDKWANIVQQFLKPGGEFIIAEFHPVVWMFDDDFTKVGYNYFNVEPIQETESGTYADPNANITSEYITWNHPLGEVFMSLINSGLSIAEMHEFDYSPYDCFSHTEEFEPARFRIKHLDNKIPMVYSLRCVKT
ncbi:MAG: class I SAM-dependent methyltransferase [Crocinitomicaceae bacterium]|nr:class I SAM-dependent methyltransferase [Crocinitomicaceae bacterium]